VGVREPRLDPARLRVVINPPGDLNTESRHRLMMPVGRRRERIRSL
jgi:hypothetical protein